MFALCNGLAKFQCSISTETVEVYRPHTTVKNARSMKSVSRSKLPFVQQELPFLQMFISFANQNLAVFCVKWPWNRFSFSRNIWCRISSIRNMTCQRGILEYFGKLSNWFYVKNQTISFVSHQIAFNSINLIIWTSICKVESFYIGILSIVNNVPYF